MFKRKIRTVTVNVSNDLCSGCGKCVTRCRSGAMRLRYREDKAFAWLAYPERCVGCGKCEKVCKTKSIDITELNVKAAHMI